MLRVAIALALSRCASAFVTPISHVPAAPRTSLRAVPETLSALQDLPTTLTAFADQGGNLAGKFFMGSLPPYVLFLYFLNYEKNNAPPLVRFGFAYLLLFVLATIPTGIISKTTWGVSLADADWLHGGAEALLTVTNIMLLLGFRNALKNDVDGSDAEWARLASAACAIAATILIATGVPLFHFEAHEPFLGGLGALGIGQDVEPVNALSIPTWIVHFSSVCEFILAMKLATVYAKQSGDEKWNGVAWGMLPSHASGVCACTYHLFYNQAALSWLVTAQAGLTFLGNTTLFIAALRLALANGWTLSDAIPKSLDDVNPTTGDYKLDVQRVEPVADLTPDLVLTGEIVAVAVGAAYLTKYGSLVALPILTQPNSILAALILLAVPATVAYTILPRPAFASGVGEFEGFSLPSFGGDGENAITYDDVKKFGVSGTIAYVLTELAFWAVAFPVAAALFTQANGHAPDLFNSGEDRAAVIASIFVGANVARLAVPLRFGVALAAAPWVDENIVQRFGGDSVDVEAVVEEEPVAVEKETGFSMPELPTFKNPFE
ncbi:unnamed protein product [Pelagomonas calceolata]|uniref:Uncharacterized protein n=1 Tax=Pelagomonas calceolata TaxID=35677 RepID=A0A7S4E764_9STRA|nr:unnamed protein product [Pelagomonas calceolata]|mmetsp:Transcript_25104/g.70524  ORF Transcript_25104/g.70524 Transcript_25104/m.70524 type:complete len:549 (-) Transcript_25104:8-1654(-)